MTRQRLFLVAVIPVLISASAALLAWGELIDRTQAPNALNEGINKSLEQQIGEGRGNIYTPSSSAVIITRDPFRAIRPGRQIFQRKFTRAQGQGPNVGDGRGDINTGLTIGAGLADSCAGCHGRPRGSAGFGGDVATRPDSRDAPHLFGLGLKEMLADEITTDLRSIRQQALDEARARGRSVTRRLVSKGIGYGSITMNPDGTLDTSQVRGVDADPRGPPVLAPGGALSHRARRGGGPERGMG